MDMFDNFMSQRKLKNQEEHEEIDFRIQKKRKLNDDDDSIEESILAIASEVTSLRVRYLDCLQSSFHCLQEPEQTL